MIRFPTFVLDPAFETKSGQKIRVDKEVTKSTFDRYDQLDHISISCRVIKKGTFTGWIESAFTISSLVFFYFSSFLRFGDYSKGKGTKQNLQ